MTQQRQTLLVTMLCGWLGVAPATSVPGEEPLRRTGAGS